MSVAIPPREPPRGPLRRFRELWRTDKAVARMAVYTTTVVPDGDGVLVHYPEPVTVSEWMSVSDAGPMHHLLIGVDLEAITKSWDSGSREKPMRIPGENGRSEWVQVVQVDEPEHSGLSPVPERFVGREAGTQTDTERVDETPVQERKRSRKRASKAPKVDDDQQVVQGCRLIARDVRALGSPATMQYVQERILRNPAAWWGQKLIEQTVARQWIAIDGNMVSPGPKVPDPLPEETGGWGDGPGGRW